MMPHALPLLAQSVTRTTFEWGRIQSNADWVLPIVVTVLILLFVRLMYRKDSRELGPALGWLLTALRTAAMLALLVLYLQPQWRTEQERQVNSRAVLLVDNSLSMGLTDAESPGTTRAGQIIGALEQSPLIEDLRKRHNVAVLRFAETLEPVASLEKLGADGNGAPDTPALSSAPPEPENAETPVPEAKIDWKQALAPVGGETRLGQALRQLIHEEHGGPVAGVILVTDGGQNAGISPETAIAAAQDAKIPVFAVGVGSDQKPANVRVSDFVVPARAYPGDQYSVTGYLQAQRMAGQRASVELFSKSAGAEANAPGEGTLVESRQVILGGDGEVLPVRFDLSPEKPGRQTLTLRVAPPPVDRQPADNHREADVEIVDRKNRVLLFAGGPMREYRFLRNQLHRDASTTVDVLLQTARPGVSQDAHAVLEEFPSTREAMFQYDCVVAFDPDWKALNPAQIDLLETWVAEQGGGLVVIAGPVHMGSPIGGWIEDEATAKIRALYPVTFQRRFAVEATSYVAKEPWPLDFTREGLEAEYLWLADDAAGSRQAWGEFPGAYSFFPVRGAKPGATVLARFGDPRAAAGDKPPVYMASQFYGSGRVFYLGSAEMWRLRRTDETFFEKLYTKLLRHVSQGRLLRGSARGVLLVERDRYVLGGSVEVRAQLTNAQLEPLVAAEVAMQVIEPDGTARTVVLRPDASRVGTFAGRFTAAKEGAYRLELPVPQSDEERLTRRIQVNMPDLERENPERNDALLGKLAAGTEGKYYVGLAAAFDPDAAEPLVDRLPDRTKTIVLTAAPDRLWEQTWLAWMMYLVCGLLCVEWTIRRLAKLA